MRRRTADFLQGEHCFSRSLSQANVVSSPKSTPRKRGKGEEDSKWADFQGGRKLKVLKRLGGILIGFAHQNTMMNKPHLQMDCNIDAHLP